VYASINASGEFFGLLSSGIVTSNSIASGSVGQFKLASGAVNSGHIGDNAVVSGSIASGQVGQFHIASGVITANHIASGAIITADIVDNAVVSGKIASGVVAWFNLASGAVLSGHIGNNAVVSGSIASGQIFTFHIVNGGLLSGAIGSGQIGQAHLASGAVLSGDIGNTAVVSGNIASGAIGQMHLSSGTINSGHIGNAAVVSGSVASGQIGISHLASGVLSSAVAAGSSGQLQFNNAGAFAGTAGLTYSVTSGTPNLTAQSQTAWNTTIAIRSISGHATNLTEWQSSSGTILSVVNQSGAIGIGTGSSQPTAFFEVNQSANKAVRIGDVAGSFDNTTYNPDITTLGAVISLQTGADTTYRQSLYGYQDASANAKLALFSRSDLMFLTYKAGTDSRQMVIKGTTGNVGINTMTPSGKLHVTTTTASDKVAIFQGYTSQTGNIVEVQNSAGNPFVIATPSGTLNVMQAGGTLGFDEIRISHDGTKGTIRSIDGDLQLGGGNSAVNIRNSGNAGNGNLNASLVYTTGVNSADILNSEGRTIDSYQWAIDSNSLNWNRSFNIRVGWSHIKGYGHAGGLKYDGDGSTSGSYACLVVTNGYTSGGTLAYYSSTTTISASTDNFRPTSYSAFQRLSPTANWNLTGMNSYPSSVTSGGSYPGWVHIDGRVMWLHNVSSTYSITLKHQQTSDAVNQFYTETQGDMVIGPGKMVQLTYDNTIQKWRVNGSQYPYNWPTTGVTSGYIFSTNASGTVSLIQSHLFSGAINSGQIGNNAVASGNIASGQITSFHIASGVLSTAVLGSGQVVSGSIASGQVGQMHLSSGAVNSGHIGNNAVVSGSIASGQIGQFHIASGVITANHIASGAIITADIADNAVVSGKIASGVVAWFNLASGTVLSGHIGNNAVTSGNIASGQIFTFHMASGGLLSGAIGSGQIGSAHIASGAVVSGEIGNAAVVSGSIASGQIGANHLASGTY
jgi:trimeric autotransporter adhesin